MQLILPKPGRYLVAVSGGIDSVCLLDILASNPDYRLTVAHFDHGIRPDSALDQAFVKSLAEKYNLPFLSEAGYLGPEASEDLARNARYDFLRRALEQTKSAAILTAHHQDDRLETLIINLIRGTGRLGVASIGETKEIKRPLLKVQKAELLIYAKTHNLSWREDASNSDQKYLRNYIRHHVLPKISPEDRAQLVRIMDRQLSLNKEIDDLTYRLLRQNDLNRLSTRNLSNLSYFESKELIAQWLRLNRLPGFNQLTIERLTLAAKTKRPGTRIDIYGKASARVEKGFLALIDSER